MTNKRRVILQTDKDGEEGESGAEPGLLSAQPRLLHHHVVQRQIFGVTVSEKCYACLITQEPRASDRACPRTAGRRDKELTRAIVLVAPFLVIWSRATIRPSCRAGLIVVQCRKICEIGRDCVLTLQEAYLRDVLPSLRSEAFSHLTLPLTCAFCHS